MRVDFEKVSRRAVRKGVCKRCGKRRQQSQEFYQTLNPFNKGKDGLPKTREQIVKELDASATAWSSKPPYCATCCK